MRSLQKVSHQRPRPIEDQLEFLEEQRHDRRRTARRKRLGAWMRTLLPLAGLALIAWVVLILVHGLRRTADALAFAEEVVLRAPARVRVVEVLVRPGELCRAQEVLLRLEAVEGRAERRLAQLEVERARQRLAWFDAGGDLAPYGEALREDRIFEARRRIAEAELGHATAIARIQEVERGRDALHAVLATDDREREGQGAVLAERVAAAEAELGGARAALDATRFDAHAVEHLTALGAAATREAVVRDAARRTSEGTAAARAADRRARETELASLLEVDALNDREDAATLAAFDATLEVARREALALEELAAVWRTELDRQQALDPVADNDPEQVRAHARVLHEIDLQLAEARLARLEYDLGDRVLVAPADGVVAWVAAAAGTVVEPDVLLLRLHAHGTLRLVAYPIPEVARELPPGTRCHVHPEDGGAVLEGHVASVAAEWVPRPGQLPAKSGSGDDLRMPLEVVLAGDVGTLVPGARCKVVFDQSAPTHPPTAK